MASGIGHATAARLGSTEDIRRLARSHVFDRLGHMLETSVMLALTRKLPVMRARGVMELGTVAAMLQDRRAGRPDTQAAHILPCQILIRGRPPWDLDLPEALRLALAARFSATAALPAPFNRADSEAETSGLGQCFLDVVRLGWNHPHPDDEPVRLASTLLPQMGTFLVQRADAVFRLASMRKRQREDIEARAGQQATADERLVEALILTSYAEGIPGPSELVQRIDWHGHAGRQYPWRLWMGAVASS